MIVFKAKSGREIVYYDTEWAKRNVYPWLIRQVRDGRLTVEYSTIPLEM